jgi:hypothetical protein
VKPAEQVLPAVPQAIPDGLEVIAPATVLIGTPNGEIAAPLMLVIASMLWLELSVNVAVTLCADDIETVHVKFVPEHPPPLQPVKL